MMCSDGVLWSGVGGVSELECVWGGGGGDMGQRGVVREAVPGAVHKRGGAGDVRAGEHHSRQDRRLRRRAALQPLRPRHHSRPLHHRLLRPRQPLRRLRQHRVPTVSPPIILSLFLPRTSSFFHSSSLTPLTCLPCRV